MSRKRTLADDLADLATTAPAEYDFEKDELNELAAVEDSEEEAPQEHLSKRARKVAEKPLRLRAGIDVNNREYAGQKTSRAALYASESEESEDDGSSRASSLGDDKQEGPRESGLEVERPLPSDSGGDASEGETDSQSKEDVAPNTSADGDEEPSGKKLGVQSADIEGAMLEQMKARLAKDQAKAVAIKHQRAIWEQLLGIRILVQQIITASHRLPPHAVFRGVSQQVLAVAKHANSATQAGTAAIGDLLGLHSALVRQNTALRAGGEAAETADGLADAHDVWRRIDESYNEFRVFKESSLDQWYRKTLLSSGQAALKGNLRLMDQTISKQVKSMVQNPRQLQRARLGVASAPRQLCTGAAEVDSTEAAAEGPEDSCDPERYDDIDFYQHLLKEFLEGSRSSPADASNASRRLKKHGNRDRRASKGRRIRYDVQEKLVNFMVPRKYEEPPMAGQLFRNLFGQSSI